MQQSNGSLGHRKHRQLQTRFACNKNKTVSLAVEKQVNQSMDEAAKMRERKKPKMYKSVKELFDAERDK